MNRKVYAFISRILLLALAACSSNTVPTAEPTVEHPTATLPAPTDVPTSTPIPEPTVTPTEVPPTPEPEPSTWEPQRPGSPCEPSGTRTCNILYILADQYDDEHVLKTDNHFEMAGYSMFVASNTLEEIRGFHACYDFTPAYPDMLLEDVDVADFDVILFAGSDGNTIDLHSDPEAHRVARDAMERGIVVAAVGDGPVVLARAGLLEGRTVTVLNDYSPFGIGEQWRRAVERGGGTYVERSLVRDDLLVTADFASIAFAWGVIEVAAEIEPELYSLGDTQARPADGMTLVYVPGGEFEMGAPGGGDTDRLPIHTVFLDGFWLDQTEVTNGQYAECVAVGVCGPSLYADYERYNGENQPVVAVTWYDAQVYCEWVGGSLPTEAQWEYAARSSANSTYPWGEDASDCERANYFECVGTTADVGSYPAGASWCGALDLAGNVYEWTADWSASYSGERQVNPVGPESGERKIIRGGSWIDPGPNLLSAQRMRYAPDEASDTVGFRCVVPPVADGSPGGAEMPVAEVISADTAGRLERLRMLEGHSDRVTALAFSADGVTIASSSWDDTIRLWNVHSGQEIHTFNTAEVGMNNIAFSPDGRLLASADAIWDVASKQVIYTLEQGGHNPGRVAFSPDGALLAVHLAEQTIKLWDVSTGQVVRTFDEQADGNVSFSIEFSPDGALLAAGGHGGVVTLWDVEQGHTANTLEYGVESDVHDIAFSPDGSVLASGGTDQTVRLWDVASGQMTHTLQHWNGLYGVAFSPDGSLLASAVCDRTVRLWDVASGRLVGTLSHGDEVMAVTFSPDGTLLISGGYDNQIYVWGLSQ